MRLIDVDDAIEKINCLCVDDNENWIGTENQSFVDHADVIDILSSIPTVDAVPVVRCKDCKYLKRKTSVGGFCKCGEVNGGRPFGRVNDDFCSYGKRRKDNA